MAAGDAAMDAAILIGLGSNLSSADGEPPLEVCLAALQALQVKDVVIEACSHWYHSAPVPASDQPWFVNGVARVATGFDARRLLDHLLETEAAFGRVREARWQARVLDLDLLAYGRAVIEAPGLTVPHPAMMSRAFVLRPLLDVAPEWRHPVTGESARAALARCPPSQRVQPLRTS
jgi:2-amino-4-hydroxy-6-hydroxymethyldihydropteridine diphosphokinase